MFMFFKTNILKAQVLNYFSLCMKFRISQPMADQRQRIRKRKNARYRQTDGSKHIDYKKYKKDHLKNHSVWATEASRCSRAEKPQRLVITILGDHGGYKDIGNIHYRKQGMYHRKPSGNGKQKLGPQKNEGHFSRQLGFVENFIS